jgi:hypothetical protein
MKTAFMPMIKRLIQNPYPSQTASVVLNVNMTWQVHSTVVQEVIARFIFDKEIDKSVISHLANTVLFSHVSSQLHHLRQFLFSTKYAMVTSKHLRCNMIM